MLEKVSSVPLGVCVKAEVTAVVICWVVVSFCDVLVVAVDETGELASCEIEVTTEVIWCVVVGFSDVMVAVEDE